MKTIGQCLAAAFLGILSWSVVADDTEHREHDAHVHGTASLNIAIDSGHIDAELVTPAMNIVGFEHAPRDDAERQAVASAAVMLEDGAALLVPSAAAGCRLDSSQAASSLIDTAHEPETTHDAHEHDHDDVHSEFHVHYRFHCDEPAAIETIQVNLFEAFPGMETIEVQALTADRQVGGMLTPEDNVIELTQ